jgi:hypothetical protein
MKDYMTIMAYLIYLPIVLILTFLVARTLFKTGSVFMLEIFHGQEDIAHATNRLFQLGFYLLNIGYAFMIMKMHYVKDYQDVLEILSRKIGGFSIYLGIVLFLNLFMFFRGKKKSKQLTIQTNSQ